MGDDHAFTTLLQRQHGITITSKEGLVTFKKLSATLPAILERQRPTCVMLQMGNYEMAASATRFLKRYILSQEVKDRYYATAKLADKEIPGDLFHKKWSLRFKRMFLPIVQLLTVMLFYTFWMVWPSRLHLGWIRLVKASRQTHFIILEPLPCLRRFDNLSRCIGGVLLRHSFRNQPHVTLIPCFGAQAHPHLFIDDAHLNAAGHQALADCIFLTLRQNPTMLAGLMERAVTS